MISGTDIKLALSTLSDLVKKGMTIEAQEKIMDLREMVTSLREQCVDLREENTLLKLKLAEKETVFFEGGVYWAKKDDGTRDGPFCPTCHDKDSKRVRMKTGEYTYFCHVCNFEYEHTPDNSPPIAMSGGWGDGAW